MSVSTSLYVLFCAFIFKPTSAGTWSSGYTFHTEFLNSAPYEVPSIETSHISVVECVMLCTTFHSENCTAFFYNTNTKSCSIYNSSLICVTLRNQTGTKGYVYDNNPVTECPQNLSFFRNYYDNDGWLVIQRRTDGSENFNTSWVEYENGFGDATNELWLGNKYIHELTSYRTCELQIDLEAQNGNTGYIRYSQFSVAGADDKYRMSVGNKLAGNLHACLTNGQQFSTTDQDNDEAPMSCAHYHAGGWWYSQCGYAHLNGRHPCYYTYCNWWCEFGEDLSRTQLKIRPA